MESSGGQGGPDEKVGAGQFDFEALERWRSTGGGGGRGAAEVETRWRREGERLPFDQLRTLDKCNVNNPFENKHIAMMLKSQPGEALK